MRAKKSKREVIVKIPKQMLNENEHTIVPEMPCCEEFVYISTKRYETSPQAEEIREELMKGYVEMSAINLTIAVECSHLEYEAHDKLLERYVIGG